MVSELSILIPVYNQDVQGLVYKLLAQCRALTSRFEIILYDDASHEKFRKLHRPLNAEEEVRYIELRENIGRAAIRNRLAADANFNYLLFLDNDSALPDHAFIKRYWESNEDDAAGVVVGGTVYEPVSPSESFMLRWKYGREREEKPASQRAKAPYQSLTLNNMLIKKEVYIKHPLCTSISGYGHEDTKFGWELEAAGVPIKHIDNPVIHLGLEVAADFLEKTRQGVKNLYHLYLTEENIPRNKLISAYELLRKAKLCRAFVLCFQPMQELVLDNLRSPDPNLKFFDLYKLFLFTREALNRPPQT